MEGRGSPPPDGDTPPDWGDDSQTDDDITHSNWPWGNKEDPPTMDAVKEFWGNSPTSLWGGHRAGEYDFYPTACGKRSVKYKPYGTRPTTPGGQ